MCLGVLSAHHAHPWYMQGLEWSRSLETGVRGGCEVPMLVLRIQPGSSGRVVSDLNHWVISLGQNLDTYLFTYLWFLFVFVFEAGFLCVALAVCTHSIGQAGLKLRDLPASISQVVGPKVYTTTAWLKIYFYLYVCLCVCMHTYVWCLRRPEEGVESPGAWVIGNCELPVVGAGKWTLVLCKSSNCFYLLGLSLVPSLEFLTGHRIR